MRMPPLLAPPWLEALALLPPALLLALTDVPPREGERDTGLPLLAVMPPVMLTVLPLTVGEFVPAVTVGEFVALPVVLLSAMPNAAVAVPVASRAAPKAATTDLLAFMRCPRLSSCTEVSPALLPGGVGADHSNGMVRRQHFPLRARPARAASRTGLLRRSGRPARWLWPAWRLPAPGPRPGSPSSWRRCSARSRPGP